MTTPEAMFDPELFRQTGHALIDLLAENLRASLQGQGRVLHWQPPSEAERAWNNAVPMMPTLTPEAWLQTLASQLLPAGFAIHHPRNLGHQVAPPLPMAALCDLVAALTNQAMAVYEAGPAATLLERQVVRWLAQLIGWSAGGGVLTSGGAQGNLTALLAARQHMGAGELWQRGVGAASSPLRILASEHAHYSISRAAGIMGLGTDAVLQVAVDRQGRMELSALAAAHAAATAAGASVMAVVASAGCTPTGSIDPLAAIGDYCRRCGLWLHVDAAHGGSALLSAQHRDALDGIALADSVVWDGHKLLYMPATVSAVLFRAESASFAAFSQQASYLFQGATASEETYNLSYRTLECTKRMMALKLWSAFSLYGVQGLGGLVDRVFSLARRLARKIQEAPDFMLLMEPQTNIVCFRYSGLDQKQLRQRLVESGAFHLTQVELRGVIWLRATVMNPMTDDADFDALLSAIRKCAIQEDG